MVNALIWLVLLAVEQSDVSPKILVLNGPNLNMLGQREPDIYGSTTLEDIKRQMDARAGELKLAVDFRQTNDEGELVTWIQGARGTAHGLIINAAAYTHTSVAVLDALLACGVPVVEVHLSNIYRREEFRHHSYVSRAATGIICGFGAQGYVLALDALAKLLSEKKA
ncbi:MAG: type II 3-dehydroquinate dehydratase [Rhodospirillaceae bacterium]|nr:type II 3-dehydroquinate dehydratase [Rhodospirillaceae bacterium]